MRFYARRRNRASFNLSERHMEKNYCTLVVIADSTALIATRGEQTVHNAVLNKFCSRARWNQGMSSLAPPLRLQQEQKVGRRQSELKGKMSASYIFEPDYGRSSHQTEMQNFFRISRRVRVRRLHITLCSRERDCRV